MRWLDDYLCEVVMGRRKAIVRLECEVTLSRNRLFDFAFASFMIISKLSRWLPILAVIYLYAPP